MLTPLDEWTREYKLICALDYNENIFAFDQQVIKTLAYFSTHLEKLAEHDMRMLCRHLLFEGLCLELH